MTRWALTLDSNRAKSVVAQPKKSATSRWKPRVWAKKDKGNAQPGGAGGLRDGAAKPPDGDGSDAPGGEASSAPVPPRTDAERQKADQNRAKQRAEAKARKQSKQARLLVREEHRLRSQFLHRVEVEAQLQRERKAHFEKQAQRPKAKPQNKRSRSYGTKAQPRPADLDFAPNPLSNPSATVYHQKVLEFPQTGELFELWKCRPDGNCLPTAVSRIAFPSLNNVLVCPLSLFFTLSPFLPFSLSPFLRVLCSAACLARSSACPRAWLHAVHSRVGSHGIHGGNSCLSCVPRGLSCGSRRPCYRDVRAMLCVVVPSHGRLQCSAERSAFVVVAAWPPAQLCT